MPGIKTLIRHAFVNLSFCLWTVGIYNIQQAERHVRKDNFSSRAEVPLDKEGVERPFAVFWERWI